MIPPARAVFSAADDPWIDVRDAARYHRVGLRGLFANAHRLTDLAWAMAPAASALLRLCVAITARLTGLDDPDLSATDWNERRRHLLADQEGFDPHAVDAYFDRYCFDVFDPVRPWMQDAALKRQCPGPSGINRLVFGRPAGNNLAWLSPHRDQDPLPLPTGQALQHLLVHHYYGSSGGCTSRTTGNLTRFRTSAGPLRSTVSFHPLGRTLYETLLAGLPKFTDHEQLLADHCPWEQSEPADPQAPLPVVTWPGRLLTGRSRHALLLVPGQDGTTVSDAYLTWATQRKPVPAIDPYVIIRTDARKPPGQRLIPRRADADRAWWRELDALLLAPDEHRTVRRPAVFDTLNDLPDALRKSLRVRVYGFDQDGKTIQRRWYTALTPPILAWAQENDPKRAQRIGECCTAAEDTATRLTYLANRAFHHTTSPAPARESPGPRLRQGAWTVPARAAYWPQAEKVFWRLLEDTETPARTAFADAAATALRTVTASARFRHRAAARAVAVAVDALYRPPPAATSRKAR